MPTLVLIHYTHFIIEFKTTHQKVFIPYRSFNYMNIKI